MKAFVYRKYGHPKEVLKMEEWPKPTPKGNEVLIKANAWSLNPSEWHRIKASIWMLRLSNGLRAPKDPILGADIAGVVVEVGREVRSFQVGDRVVGRNYLGGLAEYACLEEDKTARIPAEISFEQAAAIPLASITALIALRDKGVIRAGQSVLINGASGGIGTFAVQLARYFGASVTAVCSGKNGQLVRSLGAQEVINYQEEDFTQKGPFDLLVDLIGNRSIQELQGALSPNGRCVMVGYSNFKNLLGFVFKGAWLSKTTGKQFVTMDAQIQTADVELVLRLVQDKKLQVVIDRVYDFEEIPEAFAYLGTRRVKGKIVIQIAS
ncbi:MAG: NAD(P)-dependent alcohol dehydrogenase [Saprospiraceae bacterium]|nr:NAD(P)-dependent alcohol dehydrogenase [Saprospiraceae bacterium]